MIHVKAPYHGLVEHFASTRSTRGEAEPMSWRHDPLFVFGVAVVIASVVVMAWVALSII